MQGVGFTVWLTFTRSKEAAAPKRRRAASTKASSTETHSAETKGSASSASSSGASESTTSDSQEPKTISLKADVQFNNYIIRVTNKSRFAWTDVKMYLNGIHVFGATYKHVVRIIRPGSTLPISAMDFTTSDGTRFNPFATKILRLDITCKTPKGDGVGSWGETQ